MDFKVLTVIKEKLLMLESKWQGFWPTLRQMREGCPEEVLFGLMWHEEELAVWSRKSDDEQSEAGWGWNNTYRAVELERSLFRALKGDQKGGRGGEVVGTTC